MWACWAVGLWFIGVIGAGMIQIWTEIDKMRKRLDKLEKLNHE